LNNHTLPNLPSWNQLVIQLQVAAPQSYISIQSTANQQLIHHKPHAQTTHMVQFICTSFVSIAQESIVLCRGAYKCICILCSPISSLYMLLFSGTFLDQNKVVKILCTPE
jgi:hypothetical protein